MIGQEVRDVQVHFTLCKKKLKLKSKISTWRTTRQQSGLCSWSGRNSNLNICCHPSTWSTFLYAKLEGPPIAKSDSYFPWYNLLNDFQGPLDSHSHNCSWLVCKVALSISKLKHMEVLVENNIILFFSTQDDVGLMKEYHAKCHNMSF